MYRLIAELRIQPVAIFEARIAVARRDRKLAINRAIVHRAGTWRVWGGSWLPVEGASGSELRGTPIIPAFHPEPPEQPDRNGTRPNTIKPANKHSQLFIPLMIIAARPISSGYASHFSLVLSENGQIAEKRDHGFGNPILRLEACRKVESSTKVQNPGCRGSPPSWRSTWDARPWGFSPGDKGQERGPDDH
jgi:hypothetical protein